MSIKAIETDECFWCGGIGNIKINNETYCTDCLEEVILENESLSKTIINASETKHKNKNKLSQIDYHVNKINSFMEKLDNDELNKFNVQTLVKNELRGIQNQLQLLGFNYID